MLQRFEAVEPSKLMHFNLKGQKIAAKHGISFLYILFIGINAAAFTKVTSSWFFSLFFSFKPPLPLVFAEQADVEASALIRTENTVYKAAICLLEDITSLNLAVCLTEPRAFRLSGRQTRGGECVDSDAKGRQT